MAAQTHLELFTQSPAILPRPLRLPAAATAHRTFPLHVPTLHFFCTRRFKPLRSAAACSWSSFCLLPLNMLQHAATTTLQFVAACLAVVKRCTSAAGTLLTQQPLLFLSLFSVISLFSPFPQVDQTAFISDQKVVYSAHIRWENKMIFLFASSTSCKQRQREQKKQQIKINI